MNYDEALQKVEQAKQVHVLKHYDGLTQEQKSELLSQIEVTDFSVIDACRNGELEVKKGEIKPLAAMELSEISEKKETFLNTGLKAIRAGKVGAVLLAGGMGTRLGSDAPKGVYNIGLTKDVYIFERLIRNLLDVVDEAGVYVHLFVMTSDKNDQATRSFLKEHSYFGYKEEFVHFFMQDMAPATNCDGDVYMESTYKMSTSPNGNGGWFSSLVRADLLSFAHEQGVEWLNVFAVDNVLQRIADPVFVGATIEAKAAVGAKVVRKNAPDEKVGVMCLEDGRPSIVEYYELTDELMNAKNESGDPAYNFGVILNYLFDVAQLEEIYEKNLPLHVVEKKIPYMNEAGEHISPESPNGYKYENLVLDMIHSLDSCLPFEVVRNFEFAPIKNKTGVDSVESARVLLEENGVVL
ncbi:MAG: UTP--glucose-1-phosphate uridylyltransferase [Lachnospiraceae bacterium]